MKSTKENILWILLIILFICLIFVNCCYFIPKIRKMYKTSTNYNSNNSTKTKWHSYAYELYENDKVIDSAEDINHVIIIDNKTVTMCTIEPEACDTSEYEKVGKTYKLITDNEKLINANFAIKDSYSEEFGEILEIDKFWEDGAISVFYLKKEIE